MEAASILVPSVQELAKEGVTKVPERYVRPVHDSPIVSNTDSSSQVPVIDLSKLLSQDLNGNDELQNLHSASKEWGFFQLINHGVSTSLLEDVKRGAKQFFDLPKEEKKKFWQREGDIQGFGQMFIFSEEQKLDWADTFFLMTLPSHIRKPHLFPNIPLPFRDDLDTYSSELENLALKILDLMAKALAVEANEIKGIFKEGTQVIRMNYYPPCPQPELVIGLNTHSDASGLTILLQVDEVEGLQIKKDGLWIPVQPLPNAFIINIGDTLEMVTNGIYRSIEHRATVNSEKERISIATFYGPNGDATISPAPTLVTPERPQQFRSISVVDHYNGYFKRELSGKSYLDQMRIINQN